VVTQSLAEVTVLAQKSGISREAFLACLNNSVMGSAFTRYKTPAFVNLDFHPTFTAALLRKDFDLGLAAARQADVSLPVAALVHEIIQALIGSGRADQDFAALLELAAASAGLDLVSENADISDGLDPADTNNVMQYGDPRHNCPWPAADRLGYLVTGVSHWGANGGWLFPPGHLKNWKEEPDETVRYPVLDAHGCRRLRGDSARFLQQQQH